MNAPDVGFQVGLRLELSCMTLLTRMHRNDVCIRVFCEYVCADSDFRTSSGRLMLTVSILITPFPMHKVHTRGCEGILYY